MNPKFMADPPRPVQLGSCRESKELILQTFHRIRLHFVADPGSI